MWTFPISNGMNPKFLKPYSPQDTEDNIYKRWEESGFFNPDICIEKGIAKKNAMPYSIALPPPNVTGTLHMGHAAMLAIQDILIRFNRMRGKKTLWLPGTDHAAIATQSKVEDLLYKREKKTRHDLGRALFLKLVEQFAEESRNTIKTQVKKMGSSVDWSREAFTLDGKRSLAVRTAFKQMYDEELIYRGARIVNWDPKMQTTVSDDEVERKEEKGIFYYLKYGPFTIGTARPETKFGDKYVVMHPDDKRYKQYKHGQNIELEWINGPITATIIKDDAVDMEFGTGVMTITPSHDILDFEIAERYDLDKEQIIDYFGKLLPIAGEFEGMHIKKARPLIVEKLKEKGLVKKIDENYTHNLAINSRGGGLIEPQIKEQWFVDVNKPFRVKSSDISGIKKGEKITLKKLLKNVVKSNQIEIIPPKFEKTYFHWIDDLRDWCISRQIWYGHRIPVWYCENLKIRNNKSEIRSECGYPIVSVENITSCPYCSGTIQQDPDTLDTWFSSGLWTFSTLGWPLETDDFKTYHPTNVLETGYDILFFWVARMILMSGFLLGDIPFKHIYLHGLVRDEKGQKMSKSIGNVIDPLDMIKKYGADATRLSLIIGTAPGNDLKLSEDKVRGYKYFANKVWNVARFVLSNIEDIDVNVKPKLREQDKKICKELNGLVVEITDYLENFKLYLAADKLYHYFWHTFADVIIEESKKILTEGDEEERRSVQWTLFYVFTTSLKLLHPFVPFVTEEIWSHLARGNHQKLLMVESWPSP